MIDASWKIDKLALINILIKVVCGKCSRHQMPLQYDDNKMNRVCDECYKVLCNREDNESPPEVEEKETNVKAKKIPPQRPPPPTHNITINAPSIKKVLKV